MAGSQRDLVFKEGNMKILLGIAFFITTQLTHLLLPLIG